MIDPTPGRYTQTLGQSSVGLNILKFYVEIAKNFPLAGFLKVLLLDKLYRREGCGKPLNRIYLQILCFQSRIFGTKILKIPQIMFLRQSLPQYT